MNLGNPQEMTVLEVAQRIAKVCGVKCNVAHGALPPDDPKVRRPDITLARKVLGWEPRVPVPEGLERTREYFASELELRERSGR